jgi:hypothetical protein
VVYFERALRALSDQEGESTMGKIGLAFVNAAPLITPDQVVSFAKKCEAIGVDSMWNR